jgi:hypothetical protein
MQATHALRGAVFVTKPAWRDKGELARGAFGKTARFHGDDPSFDRSGGAARGALTHTDRVG